MHRSSSKSPPQRAPAQPDDAKAARKVGTPISITVVILVLSLVAWLYFYVASVPLNAAETTIVVGAIALIVICARWLWTKVRVASKGGR